MKTVHRRRLTGINTTYNKNNKMQQKRDPQLEYVNLESLKQKRTMKTWHQREYQFTLECCLLQCL